MSFVRSFWSKAFVSGWSSPDIIWYVWGVHTLFGICILASEQVVRSLVFIGLNHLIELGAGRWELAAILLGCSQVALIGLMFEHRLTSRQAFLTLWPQYLLTLLALFTEIEVIITAFTTGYRSGVSGNVIDPWTVLALAGILAWAGILHTRAMLKRYVLNG